MKVSASSRGAQVHFLDALGNASDAAASGAGDGNKRSRKWTDVVVAGAVVEDQHIIALAAIHGVGLPRIDQVGIVAAQQGLIAAVAFKRVDSRAAFDAIGI